MQESVGSTSARACYWLLKAYRKLGLQARPMVCLYDSVVTLAPLKERFLVSRLHQICMSDQNTWDYEDEHGKRTLKYNIDNEYNWSWSTEPKKSDLEKLRDPTYFPAEERIAKLTAYPNLLVLLDLGHAIT